MIPESINHRRKRKIGIVAGSGPEAGIDLWKKILDASRRTQGKQFHGDMDAPDVTVFSIPELGRSLDLEKNEEQVWAILESNLRQLAQRVDIICIACHTLHYFDKRIVKLRLPSEFVSMVDSVTKYIRNNRISKLAILGTCDVMDLGTWSPYKALQRNVKIEKPDCRRTHQLVLRIKQLGSEDPSIKPILESILADLNSEVVLLACTELSLVHVQAPKKYLIDGTLLLANDVVKLSLTMDGSIK
jgi:aspartate racemase